MSGEQKSELFTGWGYIPEKVKKAQKKIETYPYDLDAWSILLREAQSQPVEKARTLYELLVATFTNSGRYWKIYIEQEVSSKLPLFLLYVVIQISKTSAVEYT